MLIKLKKAKDLHPYSNWTAGTFENRGRKYKFEAKIYPEPSIYGIDCGNVSKLWVATEDKKRILVSFDRGMVEGDRSLLYKGMVAELIKYLNDYATKTPLKVG